MTLEEWNEYRGGPYLGFIWDQKPRADDVYRNKTGGLDSMRKSAGLVFGLPFIRKEQWGEMLQRFFGFESTQQLDTNSVIAQRAVMTAKPGALLAEEVLIPKG
ncbi:MAG: hypothetical protein HY428_01735 [Candidatus Levybacteria bacterium]|nr:hypothetical protein [Candidatus Levybacteria bacterium]